MVTGNNQLSGLDLGKALKHFPKPNLHQKKVIVTIWWSDASLGASASACSAGDLGLLSGLGKSPGDGNGNPL